jgi:GNAT superfamily N-acetyltransferase
MAEYEIHVNSHLSGYQEIYALETEHGLCDVSVDTGRNMMGIVNLGVERDYRRQGIARALLHKALDMAVEMDIKYIYGAIMSREAIEAFRGVFGEEAVSVTREGRYTEKDEPDRYDADAVLWYEVPRES